MSESILLNNDALMNFVVVTGQNASTKSWLTAAEEEAGRRLIPMSLKWRSYGFG
jgi:hypothetical protein